MKLEQSQNQHILILDDDTFAAEVVAVRLSKGTDRKISITTNVKAALECVDCYGAELELIVCDLHVPDCDGVEFLGELRKRVSTSQILLFSSANDTIRNAAAALCVAYGLNYLDSLKKPSGGQLLNVVNAALSGRLAIS